MKVARISGNRLQFDCQKCGLHSVSFVTLDELGREKIIVTSNVKEENKIWERLKIFKPSLKQAA
jgi:hypothetical protein